MADTITEINSRLYEAYYHPGELVGDDPELYAAIINHLGAESNVLVDLGAGSGGFIAALLNHRPTARVEGVELTVRGCARAFERVANHQPPPRLTLHRASILEYLEHIVPTASTTFLLCRVAGHLSVVELGTLIERMRDHFDAGSRLLIADRCWQSEHWTGVWNQELLGPHRDALPLAVIDRPQQAVDWYAAHLPPGWVGLVEEVPTLRDRPLGYVLECARPAR